MGVVNQSARRVTVSDMRMAVNVMLIVLAWTVVISECHLIDLFAN